MKRPPKANDLHSNKNKKSVQPFLLWKISRANRNSMIKRTLEDIALVMLCSFILFILTLPPLKHLEWRQWIAAIILMYKYCACLELQKKGCSATAASANALTDFDRAFIHSITWKATCFTWMRRFYPFVLQQSWCSTQLLFLFCKEHNIARAVVNPSADG